VARTLGHLAGRLQRYVADVKADINREIESTSWHRCADSMQKAAERHGDLGQYGARQDRRRAHKSVEAAAEGKPPENKAGWSDQETSSRTWIELRSRWCARSRCCSPFFVVLFIWPGSGPIYDALALPLMRALPEGAKMIATASSPRSWCQ